MSVPVVMQKIADNSGAASKRNKETALGIGGIGAGAYLADHALPRLTGKKRLYHGTSKEAWKSIRRDGLSPVFGGAEHGSGALIDEDLFVRNSQGHVHATQFHTPARAHANLVGGARQPGTNSRNKINYIAGFLGIPTTNKGKIVPIYEDYDSVSHGLRELVVDSFIKKKRNAGIDIDDYISRGAKWEVDPDFPIALRTKVHIGPEQFKRRYMFNNIKSLPRYIAKHPVRFSAGVGTLGLGAALAARGGKLIYKNHLAPSRDHK